MKEEQEQSETSIVTMVKMKILWIDSGPLIISPAHRQENVLKELVSSEWLKTM